MANTGERRSAARIFELFSVFQRKNRFTASSSGTDLTLLESHLMVEVDGRPEAPVNQLVSSLGVGGSLVSRALKSLGDRGLVAISKSEEDARQRLVSLTAKGTAAAKVLDRSANRLLLDFTPSTPSAEVAELSRLLLVLADGMEAPITCRRAIDHPLRPGLRRMARSLGLLADRQLGLPISSSQWQVLLAVSEESGSTTVSAVSERLRLHQSTVSRIIFQLAKRGLVAQRPARKDKRVSRLEITGRGAKTLGDGRTMGEDKIRRALEALPARSAVRTLNLLERLVYAGPDDDSMVLENGMEIRRLRSEKELCAARAFLVSRLVESKRHGALGDRLLPPEHATFSLHLGGEYLALCSFSRGSGGKLELEQLVGAEEALSSWYYAAFIRLCFRTFLGSSRGRKLHLSNPGRYVLPAYRLDWLSGSEAALTSKFVPFP